MANPCKKIRRTEGRGVKRSREFAGSAEGIRRLEKRRLEQHSRKPDPKHSMGPPLRRMKPPRPAIQRHLGGPGRHRSKRRARGDARRPARRLSQRRDGSLSARHDSLSRRSRARHENLSQANKLSRTYAVLLETLDKHRGKGQQKVTVEHVHVHEGGQAIVGNVEAPGGEGFHRDQRINPIAIDFAPGATMPSTDTPREPLPVARDPNGRCRMHGGKSPGAPVGNKNALRHGRYSAAAIARRRSIAELIRSARQLVGDTA